MTWQFWGLVAWVVLQLFRRTDDTSATDPASVLATRFARGEIDVEEYRKRLAVLASGTAGPGDEVS